MDRYNENSTTNQVTRSNKNKDLYDNIGNNTRYTNFTDVTNANAFNLDEAKQNSQTREGYHKMKEYRTVVQQPKVKRELEEFKNLYQTKENKIYDINSVLEEARKNRTEKDSLESKRKLKNNSYNILTDQNKEELEKYRKEKKERLTNSDQNELKELIDTITSKTLAGEIDQATSVDLLSDLMATNMMDRIDESIFEDTKNEPEETKEIEESEENTEEIEIKEDAEKKDDEEDKEEELGKTLYDIIDEKLSLSQRILDKEDIEKINKETANEEESDSKLTGADTDFYTRSMDLSDEDFEMSDDFKEKKLPLPIKIFLVLIVLVVIALAAYFIWKNM